MKNGKVPDERILSEISKRMNMGPRGATVIGLLQTLDIKQRYLFARMEKLALAGLVRRVPRVRGEWELTSKGYKRLRGGE